MRSGRRKCRKRVQEGLSDEVVWMNNESFCEFEFRETTDGEEKDVDVRVPIAFGSFRPSVGHV